MLGNALSEPIVVAAVSNALGSELGGKIKGANACGTLLWSRSIMPIWCSLQALA